jgi:branched-chain amino acid transport system permease protein
MLRSKFVNLSKTLMLRVKGVNLTKTLPIVLILVVLVFAPPFLADYYLSILRDLLLWMALSISWHFFSGSTKYISLGSAAFFGIGMYFAAKTLGHGLPLPVIVLLAGLVNLALALVIGLVTLRLRGIYFAILTFSVSMVVTNIIQWYEIKIEGTRGTLIRVFFDSQTCYYTILICTIVVLLLTTLLRRSKFGLALKMIGESEEAAVHVGVNASLYKTVGFAISAMLMGFMGAGFTTRFAYVNTDYAFDPLYSFLPPVMTLLGGIGTVYGPIIGSVTISLLEDILSVTLTYYFMIILGLILIAIVILMPDGIMGMVEKIKTTKVFGSKKSTKAPEKPP